MIPVPMDVKSCPGKREWDGSHLGRGPPGGVPHGRPGVVGRSEGGNQAASRSLAMSVWIYVSEPSFPKMEGTGLQGGAALEGRVSISLSHCFWL